MAVGAISGLNLFSTPISIGTAKVDSNTNVSQSFGDFLNQAINNVNSLQTQSEQMNEAFASGQTDNIQDVMIASEKADLSLQFALQIRNKILDGYNEIMRMQI
jgi:flagellar hook-basal body complex protein FliE